MESVCSSSVKEINSDLFISEIEKIEAKLKPPLQPTDLNDFLKDLRLNVPANEKQAYLDLLLQNHDVFSKNQNDLGCATNFTHTIHLKNSAPTYVKQFPVPEAYRTQLETQIK